MSLLPPHTPFSFLFSFLLFFSPLFFLFFFFFCSERGTLFPLALADGKLATRLTSTCTGQPSRGVWILVGKQVPGCPWRWTGCFGARDTWPRREPGPHLPQPAAWVRGWVGTAPCRRGALPSPTSILGESAGISPPVHGPHFAGSLESWRRKSFRYNTYSPIMAFLSLVACV